MFQFNFNAIKRFFAEKTAEEQEWEEIVEIATYPALFPRRLNAKKVCQMIKEDYPDVWNIRSQEITEIATKAQSSYD